MEIADKTLNKVRGAEAIVIHNGNVVLGMQKPQRWYELENGKRAAIIKTLGGQKEEDDGESSKKTILREISEELKGIDFTKMKITKHPIFSKYFCHCSTTFSFRSSLLISSSLDDSLRRISSLSATHDKAKAIC